ncbi:MAG: hypothetical protein WBA57_20210 [Elainellaceae cyanobacterium]
MKRQILIFVSSLIALVASSCGGPDIKAECRSILQTLEDGRTQKVLGTQNRQAIEQNAQLYDQIADNLESMSIKTVDIRQHYPMLIDGHRDVAEALEDRAELSNEEGVISIRQGDEEKEDELNQLQAEEMRAYNQIETAMGLISSACSNAI